MNATWTNAVRWALEPSPLVAALAFAMFALVLGMAERFGRGRPAPARRLGRITDLCFWAFTPLLGKIATLWVVTATVSALMTWTGRDADPFSTVGWGPIGEQPFWLQVIEVVVLADFVFYWAHRAFHSGRLWPFHAVHHSSPHLDWLSSMRFHPVNDIVSRVAQAIPLVLLGFAPASIVIAIPIVVVFIVITHADVPWTWGPIGRVLVSPVYHHWHHGSEDEALDTNFAGVFVLWDRLFGTYHFPHDRRPAVYGVRDLGVPSGFLGLLAYPFVAQFKRPTDEATPGSP